MWKIFSSVDLNGHFTDHSLRRSGTILFCTKIDRKLIKELTGHTSDVVNVYQITSENQKELMSKVMRLQQGKSIKWEWEGCMWKENWAWK